MTEPRFIFNHSSTAEEKIAKLNAKLGLIPGLSATWNGTTCAFSIGGQFDPPITGHLIVSDDDVHVFFDKVDLSPKIADPIGSMVNMTIVMPASTDDD